MSLKDAQRTFQTPGRTIDKTLEEKKEKKEKKKLGCYYFYGIVIDKNLKEKKKKKKRKKRKKDRLLLFLWNCFAVFLSLNIKFKRGVESRKEQQKIT